MKIGKRKYQAACQDYQRNWVALDQTLYELCRRHPNHSNRDSVNAKVWVLGRTYATGIERQIRSDGSQGSALEQLAEKFSKHHRELDSLVAQLAGVKQPLNKRKLTKILEVHGKFLQLIRGLKLVRNGQSPRSFVSKYLHFHNPAVPIYDSVASKVIKRLYPRLKVDEALPLPERADPEYWDFVRRFWRLYQDIRNTGGKVGVKLTDNYLLALAKEED